MFRRDRVVATTMFCAFAALAATPTMAQESAAEYFARDRERHGATQIASLAPAAVGNSVVTDVTPMSASSPTPVVAKGGIHALVTLAAVRNGIAPALLHGVIRKESNYRCNAYNARGQVHGVGQLKTATARSVGVRGSLYDCANGVEAAARYLKLAIARGGAGCAGISLYERGVYARPSCTAYGKTVLRMAHL